MLTTASSQPLKPRLPAVPCVEILRKMFEGCSVYFPAPSLLGKFKPPMPLNINSLKFETIFTADQLSSFEALAQKLRQKPELTFHGTNLQYAMSIRSHGLLPARTPLHSGTFSAVPGNCPGQVWSAKLPSIALQYTQRFGENNFCVFALWIIRGKNLVDYHKNGKDILIVHERAVKHILLLYQITF